MPAGFLTPLFSAFPQLSHKSQAFLCWAMVALFRPFQASIRWRPGFLIASLQMMWLTAGSLLGTPLGPPPRARQFLDKRSPGSRTTTVGELVLANPLLASLAMFRESGELLKEPVDITSNSLGPLTSAKVSGRGRIGRRKLLAGEQISRPTKPSMASTAFASMVAGAGLLNSSLNNQMDNFEPLYQVFNSTLFDLAIPLEMEKNGRQDSSGAASNSPAAEAETLWGLALPWGMLEGDERKRQQQSAGTGARMVSTTTTLGTPTTAARMGEKPWREGRLVEQRLEEVHEEPPAAAEKPPFEVTDSLELALSTAPSPSGQGEVGQQQQNMAQPNFTALVGQERFPMDRLEETGIAWKYPWERQRGEKPSAPSSTTILPPTPPTPLLAPFPPVPGASFYVDQHVSHGPYGREPDAAPELVYDPNVLQSRYGYSGILPQVMPDGQLIRFGQQKGRNFGVAQQRRIAPVQPPIQPGLSLVPAAAVFFIPAPPRLSTAHVVGDSSLPSRVHGQPTLVKPSGFWPNKSAQKWTEEEEDWKTTEKAKIKSSQEKGTSSSEKGMAPMGGNSLRWVPRDKLDRLMAAAGDAFEEFGEASKFPCLVDPPEMVLADSAPELGPGLANCFRRVRQCVFHMSRPLERRVGMALGECVLLCVGVRQCQSLVYAHSNAICDIFGVRNGSSGAGRLLHHRDFDYMEPRMTQANLSECWREITSANETEEGLGLGGNSQSSKQNLTTDSQERDKMEPGREGPRDMCALNRDIVVFKSQGYRLADRSRKQRAAVGEPPPTVAAGGEETSAAKVLGQQSSETECIFSCLVNLARGRSAFECLATTFDQVQGRCLLYGPGSTADGSVHLVPDPSFAHYEKGCIREELVELCQGLPIARYPQKTLLGFALGSRRAGSLIECLELCWQHNSANISAIIGEQSQESLSGGSICRSVVFFYEESGGHNCMLNSESRDTAPAFFVDENEALVDYASFDGCFRLSKQEETTFGEQQQSILDGLDEGPEEEDGAVAVLTPKKKKMPRLLRLRPLPERRRKPDRTRLYFTKNVGHAGGLASEKRRTPSMEKRLSRLVDSDRPANATKMAAGKVGSRVANRRHGGQTAMMKADAGGRRRRTESAKG